MKKALSLLSLAVLTVGLLGSCSKINERIDGVEKRVESIENEKIASIENQIAAINSSIADLGQIRSDISSLKQSAVNHGQDISELQEADETLKNRIDNLEDYLDGTLTKFAEKDWAIATFATLEQLDSTKKDLSALEGKVNKLGETFDGKLSDLKTELTNSINTAVSNLETRISTLEARVSALEAMIQSVSITPTYSDGSVEAVNDSLTLKCIVSPAEALIGMKSLKDSLVLYADSVKVKTKATTPAYMTIEVSEASVLDAAQGAITLKADISEYLPKGEGKALTVAVNIKNGISDFTTEFVPVYVAPAPVAPEGFVDLGVKDANGKPLYWAEKNLGASKPEEYGKYYSWGDVTGQTLSGSTFSPGFSWSNAPFNGGQSSYSETEFNKVKDTACPSGVLAQTYDVAYQTNNVWRMPTKEDFSELAKQCFLEWTENYNSTGVKGVIVWKAKGDDAGWFKPSTVGKGRKIKDDGSGYNTAEDRIFSNTYAIGTDPCLFFPAAGCGDGASLSIADSKGRYWLSSLRTAYTGSAYYSSFDSNGVYPQGWYNRYYGFPVRPVTSGAAPAPAPLPAGALKGVFSVSANKKVHFSQGNLVATIDASGAPTVWKFHEHQYDTLGCGGANKTIGSAAGDVDLFGWSTSTDSGTSTTDNYGIKTSITNSDYSGDFYDWGKAVGDGNTWRTLSKDEWTYLFDNHSKKWVTVNDVNGYVIAPDGFDGTLSSTYADDAALAANNLVFLPAAGSRDGSNVTVVGIGGLYWSSTAYDESFAYHVSFFNLSVGPDYDGRYFGRSVRLVTEVK